MTKVTNDDLTSIETLRTKFMGCCNVISPDVKCSMHTGLCHECRGFVNNVLVNSVPKLISEIKVSRKSAEDPGFWGRACSRKETKMQSLIESIEGIKRHFEILLGNGCKMSPTYGVICKALDSAKGITDEL